ncbi:MAG: hypothetical protein WC247_12265 [Porticoccaceae bacterium]
MKAIKIRISGAVFLLPDTHQFYEFPAYINRHRDDIAAHVAAADKFSRDPLGDHFSGLPDLTDFKRVTGIVGFPFDLRDPDLYAANQGIEIVLEVDL